MEGREEGREEGLEIGLEKVATNAILNGMSDEVIITLTGWTKKQITELRKKLKKNKK